MAAISRATALANLKSFAKSHLFRKTLCKATSSSVLQSGCCSSQTCRSRYFSSFNGIYEVRAFRPNSLLVRHYAEVPDPTFSQIEARCMGLMKLFDKVPGDKLTIEAHFMNDLGLDSLDVVEIIMAVEDEFGLEIPDQHAEKLLTIKDVVEYIADKTEAFE